MEIGRWGGQIFEINSSYVLGFTDLTVKGSTETEDKTASGDRYASRKNGKPTEISLTVHLNALTGCSDVRESAMTLVEMARNGDKDYFYIGNRKLVPYQLMLVDADVSGIRMTAGGEWVLCDVKMTLKQCAKSDSPGTSGSTSKSTSTGTKSTATSGKGTTAYKVQIPGMSVVTVQASSVQDAIKKAGCQSWTGTVYVNGKSYNVVKGVIAKSTTKKTSVAETFKSAVKSGAEAALNFINQTVEAAKKASAAQKKTDTKKTGKTAALVKPIKK